MTDNYRDTIQARIAAVLTADEPVRADALVHQGVPRRFAGPLATAARQATDPAAQRALAREWAERIAADRETATADLITNLHV